MDPSDQPLKMRSALDLCALTIELEPHLRTEFVRRECGDNVDLAHFVCELVRAHDDAGDFMEQPKALSADFQAQLAGLKSESPGTRIGPYRLIREIGEGGFGTVWRAEQSRPVRRHVALKIVKLGMDTRQVVARFDQERQALAVLDHPHIAKVFDAGSTPSGRPFFAMELVDGDRITDFCNLHRYPVRQRVDLFLRVCRAMHHAHQKGIVHRDLKPSNLLVGFVDGIAQPKVIDFGVAKATRSRLTELTLCTEFEQMIGTPAYMAPEQASAAGLEIDARCDVFSLGVVLYELLTGQLPIDPAVRRDVAENEAKARIREADRTPPSDRVAKLPAPDRAELALRLQTEPAAILEQLRGDIDCIVLKALETDPARRYSTALELAEDLQRHLEDQPIHARRPGFVYRLRKEYRRNRARYRAIAAVCIAVLAAGAVTLSFWIQRIQISRRSAFEKAMTSGLMGHASGMLATINKVRGELTPEQVLMLEGGYGLLVGNYEDAIRRLETATKTRGDSVAARGLLAVAYFKNGQWESYERAIKELRKMPESGESEDSLFKGFALGYVYPDEGLALLDEVAKQQESPVIHVIRGEIGVWKAMRTGNPEDIRAAIMAVNRGQGMFGTENPVVLGVSLSAHLLAARLEPAERESHLRIATSASDQLERILEQTPDRPGAVALRALQLQALGREEEAYELLRIQYARAPGGLVDLRYALELFRLGKPEEALGVIKPKRASPDAFFRIRMIAELPNGKARAVAEYDGFRRAYAGTMAELFAPLIPLLLGEKSRAIQDAREFRRERGELIASWPAPLPVIADFLCGDATAEQLIQSAGKSPIALAEAHNVIAYWHLADGDRSGAKANFEAAMNAGAFLSNAHLDSRIHLARMTADPEWPLWISGRGRGSAMRAP